MTDDLTRALRRQIAQLQAAQTYLRVAASQALPFPNVWRAETRGEQRCHELLASLGMEMGRLKRVPAGSHSTSVRPVTMARRQTRPAGGPPSGAPAPRRETPAAARGARRSGLVSFDDSQNDPNPTYLNYEAEEEDRTVVGARPPSPPTGTRGTPVRSGAGAPSRGARPAGGRGLTPGAGPRRATPSQPFRTGAGPQARWGRGAESRTPGLAPGNDGLVSLEENEVTPSGDVGGFDPDEEKLFGDDSATVVGDPRDAAPPPRQTPTPATPAAPESHARATSGLYGGSSSLPSVRSSTRPRAAAVQLNASGVGGRPVGTDDDIEPIEIGAAEDDDEFVEHHEGGFSLRLQEDDYDEEFADIEDGDDLELDVEEPSDEPVAPAVPEVSAAEVARLYAEAENAVAGGDLGAAADLFSDVIDAQPDHLDAHVARGRVFLDLGDYSRAMSDFMVAEEIANDSPEPQVAIGDLYFARKDYRRAIEYFNAALQLDPEHAMAFCRRGISHYYRKNYNDALEDLLHAQQLRPDIPNLTTYVAMAQKKKQRKKRP